MRIEDEAEIGIIGGSIAGCAAAHYLAQSGIESLVFEARPLGAGKSCGEGLSTRGQHYLKAL